MYPIGESDRLFFSENFWVVGRGAKILKFSDVRKLHIMYYVCTIFDFEKSFGVNFGLLSQFLLLLKLPENQKLVFEKLLETGKKIRMISYLSLFALEIVWKVRCQRSFSEQLSQQFLATNEGIKSRITCYASNIYNFSYRVHQGKMNQYTRFQVQNACIVCIGVK